MKRIYICPAALLLALAAGACGREDGPRDPGQDSPIEDVSQNVDQSAQEALTEASDEPGPGPSPYQTPSPAPVIATPNPPGQLTVTGALQPVNNSGVNGSLTVAQLSNGTLVTITLTGAPAGGAYTAALHPGSCGRPERPVAQLADLRVDPNGIGAMTDTVPVPATTLMDGDHVLVVKSPNAGPRTPPVACAAIPANR